MAWSSICDCSDFPLCHPTSTRRRFAAANRRSDPPTLATSRAQLQRLYQDRRAPTKNRSQRYHFKPADLEGIELKASTRFRAQASDSAEDEPSTIWRPGDSSATVRVCGPRRAKWFVVRRRTSSCMTRLVDSTSARSRFRSPSFPPKYRAGYLDRPISVTDLSERVKNPLFTRHNNKFRRSDESTFVSTPLTYGCPRRRSQLQ